MAKYKGEGRNKGKGIIKRPEGVEYKGAQRTQLHLTHTHSAHKHKHTHNSLIIPLSTTILSRIFSSTFPLLLPPPPLPQPISYIYLTLTTRTLTAPPTLLPWGSPTQTYTHILHRIREIVCIDVYLNKNNSCQK